MTRGASSWTRAATSVDPLTVVRLVQSFPSTYRLEGGANLRITRKLGTFDERVQFADELLDTLATPPVAIRAGRS